ncbi:transglutaminase family protein [Antarcticimicrobium luteum]|uniref:Transglutaminase family protein n=1 Tax=Antarcticimicrobium luteum TaxID=2547397 RepID=A0A4R5V9W2_9RHOB|nr:transglutaminase family protein [Antarcticimicrobium luteum]TDK48958.1 transglutaminase family protein [Antarcticimicrobium luteum]
MRLKITHVTTYSFDAPVHYALQQLRLIPKSDHGQGVIAWSSSIEGGTKQLEFDDLFSNHTELVMVDTGVTRVRIVSEGDVEVEDRGGVIGKHKGPAPLWLFREATPLTAPGPQLRQLASRVRSGGDAPGGVDMLHALSAEIAGAVAYETGRTHSATGAEDSLSAGHGVCQDHSHIMIAAARLLGYPARYVSGYLMMDGVVEQDASHAWAEVWTEGLGWIGFDVSNGICPDARYVRVATGRDYRDAAPIHGLRQGAGGEALHVTLQVQQ